MVVFGQDGKRIVDDQGVALLWGGGSRQDDRSRYESIAIGHRNDHCSGAVEARFDSVEGTRRSDEQTRSAE